MPLLRLINFIKTAEYSLYSYIDTFKIFFTCGHILAKTNSKLDMYLSQCKGPQKRYFNFITAKELEAFFGLMILVGVFRSSRVPIYH